MNELNLVSKDAFRVVGFEVTGTFEEMDRIPRVWQAFSRDAHVIQNWVDQKVALGVSFERPPQDFTYYAAAEVSAVAEIPAGMTTLEVPAHTYAAFTHKGPLDTLGATYAYIYREALPGAGRERDWKAPQLEVYGAKYHATSPESEFEIYVPLV